MTLSAIYLDTEAYTSFYHDGVCYVRDGSARGKVDTFVTDLGDFVGYDDCESCRVASFPSPSITPTVTVSPSVGTTATPTPTVTPTISITPSITVSISVTPTISVTNSISVSPSLTPSNTPAGSVSVTPTVTPSVTPSASVTPSQTPSPSVTPSVSTSDVAGTCLTTLDGGVGDGYINVTGVGGYYIFDTVSSETNRFAINDGVYTFNVPSGHPIAFHNNGVSNLTYTGTATAGTKTGLDGNSYTFYYNDVTVTVTGDIGTY